MEKKIKDIMIALITLFYILIIGDLIINYEKYTFTYDWIHLAIIILLCIGFYNFIKLNTNK